MSEDDISIPEIWITEGWAAADVQTESDYDDAFAFLSSAIAEIECQIECETIEPQREALWLPKARKAFAYKRAALEIIKTNRERRLHHEEARP